MRSNGDACLQRWENLDFWSASVAITSAPAEFWFLMMSSVWFLRAAEAKMHILVAFHVDIYSITILEARGLKGSLQQEYMSSSASRKGSFLSSCSFWCPQAITCFFLEHQLPILSHKGPSFSSYPFEFLFNVISYNRIIVINYSYLLNLRSTQITQEDFIPKFLI